MLSADRDASLQSNSARLEAELDCPRVETDVMGIEAGNPDDFFSSKPAPKYVQGVVRGHQAYIISNLAGEGSVTLIQPQMVWTLGRNREAGLPIQDRMMSRHHAAIMFVREENTFYLVDLNSMNGSYVNGVQVQQRQSLQDRDFLRVGNTEFFFFVSNHYGTLEPLPPEIHAKLMTAVTHNGEAAATLL